MLVNYLIAQKTQKFINTVRALEGTQNSDWIWIYSFHLFIYLSKEH